MASNAGRETWLKKLFVSTGLGKRLFGKLDQLRVDRCESNKRKDTEKKLNHLGHLTDKLLEELGDYDETLCDRLLPDDECVICLNSKSSIQTFPCGHKVTCRRCFLKTIQTAISQRSLALRCVICRTQILSLRESTDLNHAGPKNRKKGTESKSTFARRLFYVGNSCSEEPEDVPLERTTSGKQQALPKVKAESAVQPSAKIDSKTDVDSIHNTRGQQPQQQQQQQQSIVGRYSRIITRTAKQYTV